jgi:hypothetical protein
VSLAGLNDATMDVSRILCLLFAVSITSPGGVLAGHQGYPPHANVVDVTRAPYSALGDGITDDTKAIQRALNENVGWHRVLYFPKGTYLVSATLTWPKAFARHDNWGKTILRGADRDTTVIRLADGTFTDDKNPAAIMWCGGFGSADWFHNYVENLTFDVGSRNHGAVGLQFYSNNTGAVRDCRFVAADGSGVVGLDLAHRDMNGPLLVKNCEVIGFSRGISSGRAVNSQTFENITVRGQSECGFTNEGQSISIRGLVSENSVPAVSTYGRLMLTDASISGRGDAVTHPAIVNYNGGAIYLRDVNTAGYNLALADLETPDFAAAYRIDGEHKPGSLGPNISEYSSHTPATAFPCRTGSLRLPVQDTPPVTWDAPSTWAVVDSYGADPTAKTDSAAAIQEAIDSGATTVFMPGHYTSRATIIVRGNVKRIVGVGGQLNYGQRNLINFRIDDGASPIVWLEHFAHLGGGIEINTKRTVVLQSLESHTIQGTRYSEGGKVFLEDVVGGNFRFRKQRVWARQLNIENQGTHLTNNGGNVWVLGYKTERGGTLAHTLGGGLTEILGGFSYTTTAGKLAPMFVNNDSSVWTFFGEVCFNGDPYTLLIRETRDGVTKEVKRGDGPFVSYIGVPTGK